MQCYPIATSPTAGNSWVETCPLCKDGDETTSYFLLHCQALSEARQPYLPEILNTCLYSIAIDSDTLVKIILDTTCPPSIDENHEIKYRNMVYRLHNARSHMCNWWEVWTSRNWHELIGCTGNQLFHFQMNTISLDHNKILSGQLANVSKRQSKQEKKLPNLAQPIWFIFDLAKFHIDIN